MRNRYLGVVIAFGLLVAVACGDDDSDDEPADEPSEDEHGTGQPPGWKVIEDSPEQSLALSEEPLWGSDAEGTMDLVLRARFHHDAVILFGNHESPLVDRIDVVEAASGQLRWSFSPGDHLSGGATGGLDYEDTLRLSDQDPVVVETAEGERALLIEYRLDTDEPPLSVEYGVAALSGETGEVLWTTPVGTWVGGEDGRQWTSLAATADLAVAGVDPGGPGDECSSSLECVELLAIDTSDGSVLADSPGDIVADPAFPAAMPAGGTLLTHVANEGSGGQDDEESEPVRQLLDATVVALDVSTGEEQWNLSERASRSRVVSVAGDVALVQVSVDDPSDHSSFPHEAIETIVVEISTGREVASFGKFADECVSDGESLFACKITQEEEEPQLATFWIDDRDTGVSMQAVPAEPFQGAYQGYAVIGDPGAASVLLDRSGSVVDPGVSGRILAMSDRYALVAEEVHPDSDLEIPPSTYTVHEVTVE